MTEFESRDITFLENDFPKQGEIGQDLSLYETQDHMDHMIGEHTSLPNSRGSDLRKHGESVSHDSQNDELVSHKSPLRDPSGSDVHIPSGSNVHDSNGTNIESEESVPPLESQLRRSNRIGIPRRRFDIEGETFMILPQDDEEPRNIREALQCPAKEKWMKAMEEEMESMRSNQVWELVDLPKGRKAVKNKWVLKIKRNADGNIERYKARLVAKWYTQQEGIDYEETFSPVVRFTSIRLILAIVASIDIELHQMDVKTTFLNGTTNMFHQRK